MFINNIRKIPGSDLYENNHHVTLLRALDVSVEHSLPGSRPNTSRCPSHLHVSGTIETIVALLGFGTPRRVLCKAVCRLRDPEMAKLALAAVESPVSGVVGP